MTETFQKFALIVFLKENEQKKSLKDLVLVLIFDF